MQSRESEKTYKTYIWKTAIGLQQVDGLKPSEYLIRTAERNIIGDISFSGAEQEIISYPAQYLSIHHRLFEGIYRSADQYRTFNITKKEWVLDGDTVTYGGYNELRETLEYDIRTEKEFSYAGSQRKKPPVIWQGLFPTSGRIMFFQKEIREPLQYS